MRRRRAGVGGGLQGRGDHRPARLDRVLEVDRTSRAARIEAGILRPRARGALKPHGLTLRHFPQSFEFSTLGGWIATRSGGHFATLYTHIDDFVESCAPSRRTASSRPAACPAPAPGPSPDRLMIGSEGIARRHHGGLDAAAGPAAFSDGAVFGFQDFSPPPGGARGRAGRALPVELPHPRHRRGRRLRRRRLRRTPAGAGASSRPTTLSTPGWRARSNAAPTTAARRRRGDEARGRQRWRNAFIRMPYARELTVRGVINDTFETAITWDRFEEFHDAGPSADRGRADRRRPAARATSRLPLHPCLSGRAGALLHVPRAGDPAASASSGAHIKGARSTR